MTLSDLERQDARGQILQADLLNNSRTDQIRQDNSVREGGVYFYGSAKRTTARGRNPVLPNIWGFLLFMHN